MIYADEVEAYNIPSGILFHLHRELSAKRPGLLTHVGMDTYLDPCQHGGRMNGVTPDGVVRRVEFEGQTWLFFPVIPVDVAIIRGHQRRRRRQHLDGARGGLLRRVRPGPLQRTTMAAWSSRRLNG